MCRLFLTAGLIALTASGAQSQPSFDCGSAGSEVEELICSDDALAALDRRLAERFAAALEAIDALEQGKQSEADHIRAVQRGWIKGRDACWKAASLRACVEAAYLERDAELVALWMLEPPQGQQDYTCEGPLAGALETFFLDTARPAVRVEFAGDVRAGWQVPSASGGKYNLAGGGLFWTKGRAAQLQWDGGAEMACQAAN